MRNIDFDSRKKLLTVDISRLCKFLIDKSDANLVK